MPDEQVKIDPNDLYYVHPSDHPGLILVTPPFDGKGFEEWQRSIRMALSAKNKTGFITGTIAKPTADPVKLQCWERCNDMVFSWICNSLSPEIRRSVIYNNTTSAAWKQFISRFSKIGGTQLYSIQQKLGALSQGTSSFSSYFTKIKSLWDELESMKNSSSCSCKKCDCGYVANSSQYDENQKTIQLLMGLNSSYTSVRGSILLMDPLPDVDRVYYLISQEENQREGKPGSRSGVVDGVSMYVKAPGNSAKTKSPGFNSNTATNSGSSAPQSRGMQFSFDKSGSDKSGGDRKPLLCTNYKKTNHTIDRCFFIIGFPPDYPGSREMKKEGTEKRFAGSVSQAQKPDFSKEQIAQLVALLQASGSNLSHSKEPASDDFAGFSGSFTDDPYEDW